MAYRLSTSATSSAAVSHLLATVFFIVILKAVSEGNKKISFTCSSSVVWYDGKVIQQKKIKKLVVPKGNCERTCLRLVLDGWNSDECVALMRNIPRALSLQRKTQKFDFRTHRRQSNRTKKTATLRWGIRQETQNDSFMFSSERRYLI